MRPGFCVAIEVVPNRVPIRVIHPPVALFVTGDPHRMNCAAYPVCRLLARRVAGLLNGASAKSPICQKTRNINGLDNIGFDPDPKPGLFTERGETILRRHALGRRRSLCRL